MKEAQRAFRLASAANRKLGGASAWQITDSTFRRIRRAGEVEAHSEAEFSVWELPNRFQEHVVDCLLPEERILHFVHRRPVSVASRFSFLRPRHLNEGLLVITDRQVLLMSEALRPDDTLVDWGYLVTSVPVEQVKDVRLDEAGVIPRLEVEAEATRGSHLVSMEFAGPNVEACRYSRDILAHFVPLSSGQALRRLYEAEPVIIDLSYAIEMTEPAARQRLEALADQMLSEEEEEDFARFLVPGNSEQRLPAAMAIMTRRNVIMLQDHPKGVVVVSKKRRIDEIASAELRYSILGARLRLVAPMEGYIEQLAIESANPSVFQPMLQSFRALVPLMANPPLVHP